MLIRADVGCSPGSMVHFMLAFYACSFRADSSKQRQRGGNEQLLGGEVQWIVHELRDVRPDVSHFPCHGLERELEIARVGLDRVERHLSDAERELDFRSGLRSAGGQQHDPCDHEVDRRDDRGRPSPNHRRLQRIEAGDVGHGEPEYRDQASQGEQAGSAQKHVIQILAIRKSALRRTCRSRRR